MEREQHLTVPASNSSPQQSPPQNGTFTGRPRSGSQLSQPPATETPGSDRRDFDRRPSIRIRRAPSNYQPAQPSNAQDSGLLVVSTEGHHVGGRSRSNSAPQQLGVGAADGSQRRPSYMPEVAEETTSPATRDVQDGTGSGPAAADFNTLAGVETSKVGQGQANQASVSSWRPLRRARTNIGRTEETQQQQDERERGEEYDAELVDILDLVGKRFHPHLFYQLTFLQIRKSRRCRL
jgi:hypothetical protein